MNLPATRAELLADPTVLKVSNGRAQTRQMSMRSDYAWGVKTVDDAIRLAQGRPRVVVRTFNGFSLPPRPSFLIGDRT